MEVPTIYKALYMVRLRTSIQSDPEIPIEPTTGSPLGFFPLHNHGEVGHVMKSKKNPLPTWRLETLW